MSLIECGPVHTAFFEKLEGGPGGTLERADAQTRHLFTHYQRSSYEQALSEAQDPEEVIEVGANGGLLAQSPGGAWRCTPQWFPHRPVLLFPPQLFLTALRAPRPALRYFSTHRFLPLIRLRTEDPSGSNYVAAMHRETFADLQAQEGSEAGARVPGDLDATQPPAPSFASPCARPLRWQVASELCWPASDKQGQNKPCYQQKS